MTDAHAQLEDVVALGNSLRNWDWSEDAPVNDKGTRFLGLIAQEAEEICPGIVTTVTRTDRQELTPERVIPAVYEETASDQPPFTTERVLVTPERVIPATYETTTDSYKGIKNDVLIMKLLGAVAELSAKNEALEARLEVLENA